MGNRRGFKVKRSGYRLYKKKKSKAGQAAAIIFTVIIAAALLVVGYSLGKPLVEYLTGKDSRDSSVSYWTPTVEASSEESEQTTAPATTTEPVTTTEKHIAALNSAAMVISGEQLKDTQSVQAAISKAKSDGYSVIVCELKDSDGILWFKTANVDVKDSDIVSGGVAASQLSRMITSAGMTPVAIMSTLKDHSVQLYISGATYRFADNSSNWIDGRIENGGKPWLSPFNKPTSEYLASLVGEVSKAGFKTIILSNTEFPNFRQYDYTILSDIDSASKRADALHNVINACKSAAAANGASISLEISAAELISSEDFASTTAEVLNIGSKLSSDMGIVLRYDENELDDVTAIKLASGFEARFKQVTSEALKKLGGREVTPYCVYKNLTDKQLTSIESVSAEVKFNGLLIGR